jgi:hypothetical protein
MEYTICYKNILEDFCFIFGFWTMISCSIYLGIINRIMKVSVVGVTGARATVNPRVEDLLKEIRQVRR